MENTEFLGDVEEAEAIDDTGSSSYDDDDDDDNGNDDRAEEADEEKEGSADDDKFEHDKTLQILLEANQDKEKRLEQLQKELNHHKVQHKEGIYWLQLQLDTARREKDAAEERMAELQGDLKHMAQLPPEIPIEDVDVENTDGHHRAQLQKYETAVLSLENQVAMVKTSFSEINRSLKEEICDLMEDRTQVELDLLNQLSELDTAKRDSELQLTLQLQRKDEEIERLRQRNETNKIAGHPTLMQEMKQEIDHLLLLKRQAEEIIERERMEADEVMDRLEVDNEALKRKLEAAEGDLLALKSASNTEIATRALEQVTEERKAIDSSLARVVKIWEMADASVLSLKEVMDRIRPNDDTKISLDGERMLSALESASLLHAEIKVSLDLIELKLRNNLECIKNDKLTTSWAAPIDKEVSQKFEEIQNEALTALDHLKLKLSQEMRRLEEGALGEVKQVAEGLKEAELQKNHNELEAEVSRLKKSNHDSDGFVSGSFSGDAPAGAVISGSVLDQLQAEVIRIVKRIQDKNETIASLKENIAVHKHRELNLRKELKRAIRANTAMHESPKKEAVKISSPKINEVTNRQQPKKQQSVDSNSSDKNKRENALGEPKSPAFVDISSPSKIRRKSAGHRVVDSTSPLEAKSPAVVDISSPSNIPVKAKTQLQLRRNSTGHRTVDSTSPLETPPGSIRPLLPSRREIFKARHSPHSPLVVKALAFSPVKSPTGVDGQL